MSEQKVMNRWLVVVGALLIQLCLGAIYAWGAFTGALQSKPAIVAMSLDPELLGVTDKAGYEAAKQTFTGLSNALAKAQSGTDKAAIDAAKAARDEYLGSLDDNWISSVFDRAKFDKQVFSFSETQTSWIFSAGLASFAIVMILAGRLQDKYGPRIIAIIGGAVLGAGYIIAAFTGTAFIPMLVFIGIVGGAGIGMGYVCPIAACVKWFPDLKGLITGLAVAGFGAGAFIFVKLAGAWGDLIATQGVNGTFLVFGIIFAVSVIIGSFLLSNPPAGFKPSGWEPPAPKEGAAKIEVKNLTQGQTIKTIQFWMIWLAFVFSAGCGLMVIKCLKNFGQFEGGLSAAAAGSALGLLALFNGLGRVVWGTISQKITARNSVILMCILQALMMFILIKMGSSATTLAIAACWIGFNFGGNFALFPLLTLENFGPKNLGANYGVVFTSYGVGGILGPVMAGKVWDAMGTFKTAFIIAAIACLVSSALAFALRQFERKTAAA
ncbi:MAG: OFA family MFS transporter [Sedimentisphaerales bacterium]|nr:OFA family MFS transporter [Sedimentisphaerales bacterium]